MDLSYVIAHPEMLAAAAEDLAGIHATLGEATTAAAAPTTGIAAAGADDISAAIADMFGSYGQEFQALGAQASAFHDEFVNLLRSGADAYLSTEAGSASAAASVLGPYQDLITHTTANLQTLGAAWAANPAPFLRQWVANQIGYGQLALAGIRGAAGAYFGELLGVAAGLHLSIQQLAGGDFTGAARTAVVALGELTALPPSLVLPIDTIAAEMRHNITSVVRTATDLSVKFTVEPPTATLGLPLSLFVDAIGAPVTTLQATGAVARDLTHAVQAADYPGAVVTLVDAPAFIADGFLNGTGPLTITTANVPIPLFPSITVNFPVSGILASPATPYVTATVDTPVSGPVNKTIGGTPITGLVPGLLRASDVLTQAIS